MRCGSPPKDAPGMERLLSNYAVGAESGLARILDQENVAVVRVEEDPAPTGRRAILGMLHLGNERPRLRRESRGNTKAAPGWPAGRSVTPRRGG